MKQYLEDFHKMKLFRLQDAVKIIGNEKSAKDLLRNYKKQQLICQIRRNFYTVTDLATKQAIPTKFEIGSNITPSSYISYNRAKSEKPPRKDGRKHFGPTASRQLDKTLHIQNTLTSKYNTITIYPFNISQTNKSTY